MVLIKNNIGFNYLKKNQQAIILLLASLTSMIVMLGINFFLTRILTKESFGNYAYIINVFLFAAIICNFGYFYSLGRIMALTELDIDKRQLYSIGLILAAVLSIIMSISLYIYVFFGLNDADREVMEVFYVFIPLSLFFLVNNFNESTLQGSNRITLLAFSRLAPKTTYLFLLISIYFLYKNNVSLQMIFTIYFMGLIFSFIFIFIKLKPKFTDVKKNVKKVQQSNKDFGFNVYLGSIIAVGSTSLSGILISYFGADNIEVGYYSISQQFAAPLSLIPNVLATVYFRKFATAKSINKSLLMFVYGISFVSFIIIYIIAEPIVRTIYGEEYIDSVMILHILSLGILLYGVSDVYNRFLLAKGKGKELRNTSYIVGVMLLIANLILIREFGAIGAAMATVISGSIYFIVISFYYVRVKKQYA